MVLNGVKDFGMIMRSISCTDAVRPSLNQPVLCVSSVRPVWIFPAISHGEGRKKCRCCPNDTEG